MTYSLSGIAPGSGAALPLAGHYTVLRTIKNFASGQLTQNSYSGTGNGVMLRRSVMSTTAPEETWTITCTAAAANSGTFSVTGSVSGAQAAATVGVFYDNGLISFLLVDGATDYAVSDSFVLSATNGIRSLYTQGFAGAGNGKITNHSLLTKTAETWTITCTAAAANSGTFSVTGSVSGAQAAATVGVPYDNGIIQFLINDGTIDFAVSDVFTLIAKWQALPVGDRWLVRRFDDTTDTPEVILQGPGIVGVGAVYVGFKTLQSVGSDYYNLAFSAFEGYVSTNTWELQPKYAPKTCPLWQFDIPYDIRISPRQIWLGVNIEALYDLAGVGFYNAYFLPPQYPAQNFVAGSLAGKATTRYSDTSRQFGPKTVRILFTDGLWTDVEALPYIGFLAGQTVEPTKTEEQTSYVGTGDGTLTQLARSASSPNESWNIVATSATNFTVTGSVSGAQAAATVGVAYDNGIIKFILTAGGVAFVAADTFVVVTDIQYGMQAIVLSASAKGNYGELEGVQWVTGFGNAVENTITDQGSVVHRVYRSINRTGFWDYATLALD